MNIEEQNREALIAYFEKSGHPITNKVLGVEIEHFILVSDANEPITYDSKDGRIGIADVLNALTDHYPAIFLNNEGEIIGCVNEEASITLEPASQIEISIAPFASIQKIGEVYSDFRAHLDAYLHQHNAHVYALGYHPTHKAADLELIPKKRYQYMDAWFKQLGTKAERMMRGSASTQVSIDYIDEADAIRKMRAASALVPILSAITDNSPVFEGEATKEPLVRLTVWRNVDPARAGVIPGIFDKDFSFANYADWVLGASPIFVTRTPAGEPEDATPRQVGAVPAAQAYGDAPMTQADIEHLLSMYWPDVRLKRFVEIRPADSMPQELVLGYAALIKGLFYSENALSTIESDLGVVDGVWPLTSDSVESVIAAIKKQGYGAHVYGKSLDQWIAHLFDLARAGLDADEQGYLDPLEGFALSKELYQKQA